jgi:penicillin amidase
MEHHGLYPRRWKGQGRYTLVGSEPAHDWQGWIPMAENPRAVNPPQGWLASANQTPTDSTYPHYLGSGYFLGRRSARLADLLADADTLSPEGAAGILLDDYNLHAALVLPDMLRRLNRKGLSVQDSAGLLALTRWDYRHRPDLQAPAIFDLWWTLLYRGIWQDEFSGDSVHYKWPSKERTRKLILEESAEDWFDDITTPNRENLGTLVNRTFREACARHRLLGKDVPWSAYRPVQIRHLARLPALGRLGIATGGCSDCVNAVRSTHAPSLRLVVALGRGGPKAYGIYPGGQSGNPGSRRYDDQIDDWAAGRLRPLDFLENLQDRPEIIATRLYLEGN